MNGKIINVQKDENGFIIISRKWNNNDTIDVAFDMSLYAESMPDNKKRVALMYGPLVLAGNLGDTMPDPVYGTPVLLTDNHTVSDWAVQDTKNPLMFHTKNVGQPFDVTLTPFYENVNNYYGVYWDFFTNDEWASRKTEYEAEKKHEKEIEAQTIDVFRVGEMQPERDHNLKATDQSYVDEAYGRAGREVRNNGFFSFTMKVIPDTATALLCTYLGDDKNRSFDIFVDDEKIASVELNGRDAGKFFNAEYPIPLKLTKDQTTIRVKVQAINGKTAGRLFACRTIRK